MTLRAPHEGMIYEEVGGLGVWRWPAADPAIPVQSCTPAQGLVALYAIKNITEADLLAAIDGITDPVARYTARIAFARATEWRRDSQTMQTLAALLSLTEFDLDELFTYAVTVNV